MDVAASPVVKKRAPRGSKPLTKGKVKIERIHVEMADCLILNPYLNKKQLAEKFGMKPYHVALVMQSKEWVELMEEREVINPLVKANIDDRFRAITHYSQEILMERLSRPKVQDATVLKALEISSRALGYGKDKVTQNNVQQFIVQLPAKAASSVIWEQQFKEISHGNDGGSGAGADGRDGEREDSESAELQRERLAGGHVHGGSDSPLCGPDPVVSDDQRG